MGIVHLSELRRDKDEKSYSAYSSSYSPPSRTAAQIERDTAQSNANRNFPRLRQKFETLIKSTVHEIHPDTAAVYWPYERLGRSPNQLPRWDDESNEVADRRIAVVEQLLSTLIPANGRKVDEPTRTSLLMKLDVLLGPRTVEAQSTALQDFLCPERQLYRQLYWGVLTLLQQDFQQVLGEKGEQAAWVHLNKTFHVQKKLRVFLESVIEMYSQKFPFLTIAAKDFFKNLFKGDELKISWMELLEKAHLGLNNQPLLSPDTYTQEAMENQAMDKEIHAYRERVVKYLTAYPDEINTFSELLQVDFKEGSTLQENIQDIAGSMASLPSRLPSACSEYFLKRDWFAYPEVVEQMMARGAPLAHAANIGVHPDPKVWQLLQKALNNYRPKNPCDEVFRQQLLHYAQNTQRDLERWSSIMVALLEAEQQSTSLVSVLYPQLTQREARYWRNSSLFKLSEKWSAFSWEQSPGSVLLALADWRQPKPLIQKAPSNTVLQLKGQLDLLTTVTGRDFSARWRRYMAEKPAHITVLEADHVSFRVNPDEPDYSKLDALLAYCYTSPFTTLSFINTELTNQSLTRLFKKRIPTVQQLIFKQNLLTDKGLWMISEELSYWPALTTLDLSDNLITDQGVQFLLEALPNSSITQIIFGDNPAVSAKMREAVKAQLAENLTVPFMAETTRFSLFSSPRVLPRVKKQTVVMTEEEKAQQEAADLLAAFAVNGVADIETYTSGEFIEEEITLARLKEETMLWISLLPTESITPTKLNLSLKQLEGRDVSISLLIHYLSTCVPTLEEINLSGQEFKTINDTDFERLVFLFHRFPHLKVLNFDNTWLSSLQEKPMNDTMDRKRDVPETAKLSILVKHLAYCPSLHTLNLKGSGNWFGKKDCVNLIHLIKNKKTVVNVFINEDAGTPKKQGGLQNALKANRDVLEKLERQALSQRRGYGIMPLFSSSTQSYQPIDFGLNIRTQARTINASAFSVQMEHTPSIRASSLVPRPRNTSSLALLTQPKSYAKWHTLVPWDGDELIFQCSTTTKSYQCFLEQRNYFIYTPGSVVKKEGTLSLTPQQIYYDELYKRLSGLMHACKSGSSGMIKMQEGVLGQGVQTLAVPIEMVSPSVLSALQLITAPLDEHERQAYYESITSVMAILEEDKDQHKNFARYIALLLTYQYSHCVHLLTKEQARIDAQKALDWMAYSHYEKDKLVEKPQYDQILTRRLNVLMALVFGYEASMLIPMPQSSVAAYKRFIEHPPVYSVATQQALTTLEKPMVLQDLPVIPEHTKFYADDKITDPQLRRFDRFIRQVIPTKTTKGYQKDFKHSLGYYQRFFIPLLLGHGGKLSLKDCDGLNDAVKNFSLPELLRYLHTEINPKNSGFREESLQVRLIERLMQPIQSVRLPSEKSATALKKDSKTVISSSRSVGFFEERQRQSQRASQRERFGKVAEILEETIISKNRRRLG